MNTIKTEQETNILERFAKFLLDFPFIKKIRVESDKINWSIENPNAKTTNKEADD